VWVTLRANRYRRRTEQVYVEWIKRFIRYHGVRHPQEMGAEEVKAFLSHLATEMNVAASTQNQAFSALLFLYQEVIKQRLPWIEDIVRVEAEFSWRYRIKDTDKRCGALGNAAPSDTV